MVKLSDAFSFGRSPLVERKSDIKDALEGKSSSLPQSVNLLAGLKAGGFKFPTFRTKLCYGSQIQVNSSPGKYKQFATSSSVNMLWGGNLASTTEFGSLDQIFDEVFIHSVKIAFRSRNKYSGLYQVTGTAQDLATILAVIYFLPNNAADYADTTSTYISAATAGQHKVVNLAENFVFHAFNPTRFDKAGMIGDQTTAQSTMGWCQFSSVGAKYGGFFGVSTPAQSGAAIGIPSLLENAVFGDYVAYFDISVRSRA